MDTPKIVVISAQKGGVGKSTLAANLAIAAEVAGFGPVGWYDADPQQSLTNLFHDREAPTPLLAIGGPDELADKLAIMAENGIKLIIVDTPPSLPAWLPRVLAMADFVLIPTQDGVADVQAVGRTVEMVKGLDKPFGFALTLVKNGTRQAAQAAMFLSQYGPLIGTVAHRMAYKTAWGQSLGVVELAPRNEAAAGEINGIWDHIGKAVGLIAPKKKGKAVV
ncbi:ParA family protein [Asaia spathodeae]|uniref:ParA family protein n=1 Tax=Asaia spathodeae TaxID=657016 RepID=A0ABX2P9C1_9PROT|nr:ParA family protein [Asaia spathodeae]GBR16737.1 ParA-like protein [Asaia spathodeae NBRC 105894]